MFVVHVHGNVGVFVVHVHGIVNVWKRWFYAKACGYPPPRGYRTHCVRAMWRVAGWGTTPAKHGIGTVRKRRAKKGWAGSGKARVRVWGGGVMVRKAKRGTPF
jgi:hypothetical protein